jgi:hypothetical protein
MYSLLQRGIRPVVKTKFYSYGIGRPRRRFGPRPDRARDDVAVLCADMFGQGEVRLPMGARSGRSLSNDSQQLARQAGRNLQAVLDRRNAALRAEESAQRALLARLLENGAGESSELLLQELHEKDIAQPDSQVSVFAFEPHSVRSGGTGLVIAIALDCCRTIASLVCACRPADRARRGVATGSSHQRPSGIAGGGA